jgi:type IV pilus biogenesis protein CpaD/CtpE
MMQILRIAAATCVVALLSGCDALESYQNHYSWQPPGANAANLAAHVVNPVDLTHGRDPDPTDGTLAAAAVDRLRHDHVKPLAEGNSLSGSTPTAAAGLTGN